MRRLITAAALVAGRDASAMLLENPAVLIEDDTFVSISTRASGTMPQHDAHDDYPDATICPAFLDIHIHGAIGHDVMEGTPSALSAIGKFLATRGVGAYLPTTVTASVDATLKALAGLAKYIGAGAYTGARPLGIHLEGPFISHAKRGVHPPEMIQKPSIGLFNRFWEAGEGRIALMTIAPESDGAIELIRHATQRGVHVSLGHSNASAEETQRGIDAGATSATHTFNAMRPLDHRHPGILGTVLDDANVYAELICDGIHVHPALVRLYWKAKGKDRAILITDGISATGMPEGQYQLGGLTVTVRDGRCLLLGANGDETLAGSVLTLDRAVRNFRQFTGASITDAIGLVTRNPAQMLGFHREGTLMEGGPADLTLLTPTGEVEAVYLRGDKVS